MRQSRRCAVSVLVLGVLLLVRVDSARGAAMDCRQATLLPEDARLILATADVPETVARFAGGWIGAWTDRRRGEVLCHVLVVEEVFRTGHARVVYSIGTDEGWRVRQPEFHRATGRIADGVLRLELPVPTRPGVAYRLSGDTLSATFRGEGRATLSRLPDLNGVGCPRVSARPSSPPSTRDRLTASELLAADRVPDAPVHNDYFLPIGHAAPALHALKGTLRVAPIAARSAHRGCLGLPMPTAGFSVAFFTHGDHLVPVVRDIVRPPGTVIVSPGRVWSEPGDGGLSRASFPFVLVNESTNDTHNGIATFLYDGQRVSNLRFQVVQETAAWAKFDYWGQAALTYSPGEIANESALRAEFAVELQREAPIRPWSALPASIDTRLLDAFDGETAHLDISLNGLVIDGVAYVRHCHTRYGPFPYCRHMRHGAFSVTKSLGAAVALLRLAQKYGAAVFDEKIADHVHVTAPHSGWDGVTFAAVLSMATGIGDEAPQREPNDPVADENKPKTFGWLRARSAEAKLDVSFAYGKYAWGPGEVFRYNSTQTFVLAAAMDAFLKRREGPQAQLWDMVVNEVYRPIGIRHAPKMHSLEPGGARGIPQLTHGLYPTVDDIVKLTTLLQNGGRHGREQLLHEGKLEEALFRTSVAGLPLGSKTRFGEPRYHLSFWSVPYRTANGCAFQIPYMAGYGGNIVALLPNGVSAFRFSDAHSFDAEPMVLAGEAMRPFCTSPSPDATGAPTPHRPLTASELRTELTGNTFYFFERAHSYLDPSGVLYGTGPDVGRWHITDDGRYCRTWNLGDQGRPRCYTVIRNADSFEFYPEGRWGTPVGRRVLGNAERY